MKKSIWYRLFLIALFLLLASCSTREKFQILRQVTGPIATNCYLLYDTASKEAALFDVGGPIDSLLAVISDKHLKVKYIFATHCHMDHLEGIPAVREKFPDALLCYNQQDYDSFLVSIDWGIKNFPPAVTESMKRNPAMAKWFDYDLSSFGPPDVRLEENQVYKLGALQIKTILTPGHSVGSICFQTEDILLSGDVLFYRSAGRTDFIGGSSKDLIRSVRRLYAMLPDQTRVFPGHKQPTDIGSEKTKNRKITVDKVYM